jgi:hypothetical protein
MKRAFLLISIFLLGSCHGYVLQEDSFMGRGIEVPFIPGDEEGLMTQEIILSLERSGFDVVRSGSYELKLKLQSEDVRSLGYVYGRNNTGALINELSLNESCLVSCYLISLIDKRSGEVVLGPDSINISIDYDHEIEEVPYNSVQYSMGQLNIEAEAQIGAKSALGRALATEVASWMKVARLKLVALK